MADNWRHGWGVWRGGLGGGLVLDRLQLLDCDAWQSGLDNEQTVWGVARLDGALRQINRQLLWNVELAEVVAGDLVFLFLDFVLSLNSDAALLWEDFDLDLLWLEALDVEAQVQVAGAIWVDRDRVDEGGVLDNVGWAENDVTELVWQAVAHPVVVVHEHVVTSEWHHGGRWEARELAAEWGHAVVHWSPVGRWTPVGRWSPVGGWTPVGHWPVGTHGLEWHHVEVRHV